MKPSTIGRLIVIACVALIVIGEWHVMQRSPRWPPSFHGHWRAARALARGAQLAADDVREPSDPVERVRLDSLEPLIGGHLRAARGVDDPVTRDDLASWPPLDPPGPGRVQFVVPLAALDAPVALAGDTTRTVYGCYTPAAAGGADAQFRCVPTPLVIHATHRSTSRDSAWVVVEGDETPDVVALIGAAHRVLVRSKPCVPARSASRPQPCTAGGAGPR